MLDQNTAQSTPQPLVYLHKAQVRRNRRIALRDITFTLHKGENVMLTGANGAGKSTFLSLLRGDIWPVSTNHREPRLFLVNGKWQVSPLGWRENTACVSPELEQKYRGLSRTITCAQVIASGGENSLSPTRFLSPEQDEQVKSLSAALDLTHLLPRPFATLSQGEAQKALIARALMTKAQTLFLDEPGTGLDQSARQSILDLLHSLKDKGVQIIASTHRPQDLAGYMHQAIVLEHGRMAWRGKAFDLPSQAPKPPRVMTSAINQDFIQTKKSPRICLDQAEVSFGGRSVLGPVSWTIYAGEHWLIHGPNGCGKTTLLKLVAGEIHPSLGGRITRFPPVYSSTLHGLRQKIGWFSPELLTAHRRSQSGLQTVQSGLRGQIGTPDAFSPAEHTQALAWMQTLGILSLANRDILTLSSGQLRALLLARSVVNNPHMLLLDEPCTGLDHQSKNLFLRALERLAAQNVQIIMVSHSPEDRFLSLNRILTLDQGRVTDKQSIN
ncbi:MAG: ATP-binding cassette domain-containing protein [Desulfovermiculus sp.]